MEIASIINFLQLFFSATMRCIFPQKSQPRSADVCWVGEKLKKVGNNVITVLHCHELAVLNS